MNTTTSALILVTLFSSLQLMAASPIKKTASFEFDAQGTCIQLQVTPNGRAKATVNGRVQSSWFSSSQFLDGRPRIMVELDKDNLPALRPDQQTYYDSRLDHHSITELTVILNAAANEVAQVEYQRYQDIDYGYGYESTVLSPLTKVRCSVAQPPQPIKSQPVISFVRTTSVMSSEKLRQEQPLELVLSSASAETVTATVVLIDDVAKLGRDYSGFDNGFSNEYTVVIQPGVTRAALPLLRGRERPSNSSSCNGSFMVRVDSSRLTGARVYESEARVIVPCSSATN
jgi:hypothetical protein